MLAADALFDGRLVKLSELAIVHETARPYQLAYPSALRDWPPLMQLRLWLRDELAASHAQLHPVQAKAGRKTAHRAP